MKRLPSVVALLLVAGQVWAASKPGPVEGEVKVPLSVYQDLVERAGLAGLARPAPASYALARSNVEVTAQELDERVAATVRVQLNIRVFEDQWTLVPVLPGGTAVRSVSVGGSPVELVHGSDGLAWTTRKAGSYSMALEYGVEAVRSRDGWTLAVPVPGSAMTQLNAGLPGTGLDVAVIPATGVKTSESGRVTRVTASVPSTSLIQISWRTPGRGEWALSRANYTGELAGQAVTWTARFKVELFGAQRVTLPLLPRGVTLADIKVDGKAAPVLVEGDRFATLVAGRGLHEVAVSFEVPVLRGQGPPRVELSVPEIPVSRFDFTLPGTREVNVEPRSSVRTSERGGKTVATVHVPMTSRVVFSWKEAIPEAEKEEVQAVASLYHAAHAEEGVLHVRAFCLWEITRGETNLLELETPEGIQINSVRSGEGGVADWRLIAREGKPSTLQVYLDRKVRGSFSFQVAYERLLGTGEEAAQRIVVPLMRAAGVHRQRGMAALLQGQELTLEPIEELRVTRVGENQLPPFVREALSKTVAHTYKYLDESPSLVVRAAAPERKRGKFDAEVATLFSLGEVTLRGSASIEVSVKSGSLMALELGLPAGVNMLGLTGPSVRQHQVRPEGGRQLIEVEFTQEMEGQFRLELRYEQILADGPTEIVVPTASVADAEVEHGLMAVEALAAVEVQASTEQLSSVDLAELPQQLVLKTTNPILLAYRYAHVEPPYRLALTVTHHKELDVQVASIEDARYRTLFTRDGLAVTAARLTVRNSRKQFLRVELPPETEVWSVFVDGRPEKPARPAESEDGRGPESILIKMINSTEGFPVEIIYASRVPRVGSLGVVSARLPRPDMVVTRTRWDVYLPAGLSYRRPAGNMELAQAVRHVGGEAIEEDMAGDLTRQAGAPSRMAPLRIAVPARGLHFAFEKLYANQGDEPVGFSVAYASAGGARAASGLSLAGAVLLWGGVAFGLRRRLNPSRAVVAGLAGLALIVVAVRVFGTSPSGAAWLFLLLAAASVIWFNRDRLGSWLSRRRKHTDDGEPPLFSGDED